MATSNSVFSTMVRAGRSTYFIDVREARNGSRFLSISESRIDGEEKRQRATVRVFGDSVEPFRLAINEAAGSIVR
jgi:hypothetical protein